MVLNSGPESAGDGGPSACAGQKALLAAIFRGALDAVTPQALVPPALPSVPRGCTVVVGAGKAAAAMAQAVERNWPGELSGLVVTPYGHALPCERIDVVEAAHPVPDEEGLTAARAMLARVEGLGEDDLALCLFSGGGSALLPLPAGAVTLEDKKSLISQLLRVGATIGEINCVRKHLSGIKGGRLAQACAPAKVVNLLVSDVAGDDPSAIASGPAVPDPTTLADARLVVQKYGLEASAAVMRHLSEPGNETPKLDDPSFARVSTKVAATSQALLEAAATIIAGHGLPPVILGSSIEGESKEAASAHAAIACGVVERGRPAAVPCVLLSGGETTVTIRGAGRGGPNMEFLLALALALGDRIPYAAIACDSDGLDGTGEAAGALAGSDTLARAAAAGLDPRRMLLDNDSRSFFEALGDLVVTGPTYNNLNDFRAILLAADSRTRAPGRGS